MTVAACLGPAPEVRCPHGALVATGGPQAGRCAPCHAVWRVGHPRRRYDHAEAVEHRAILEAWTGRYGAWCPGDASPGLPRHLAHWTDDLTVHHDTQPVAAGGPRATGGAGKRVLCRSRNAAIGVRL